MLPLKYAGKFEIRRIADVPGVKDTRKVNNYEKTRGNLEKPSKGIVITGIVRAIVLFGRVRKRFQPFF
jgi:hypothetical protein